MIFPLTRKLFKCVGKSWEKFIGEKLEWGRKKSLTPILLICELVTGIFLFPATHEVIRGEIFRVQLRAFHELYSFSHRRRKIFQNHPSASFSKRIFSFTKRSRRHSTIVSAVDEYFRVIPRYNRVCLKEKFF